MRGFEIHEKLPRWPELPSLCVLQALTNTLLGIGARGDIEQALVGLSILYDSRRLPLHGQHHGALGFLELLHEVAGSAAECGQRLDVVRDIEHGMTPIQARF